jgi:hypothetical protein
MTVLAETQPYEQYSGNGIWTFFEYGFEMLPDSTVYVLVNGIPVTFTLQDTGVVLDVAPPLGAVINIYRFTDITQLRDWQTFESFDADKTESALDKLILLKQEAAVYRALMNLYAEHQLPWVRIVNDKGTDATIFYWNEEVAGVFGGEVTEKMPNAGAVVDKPEDFAYFQYGFEEIFTQELTSTLYPLEMEEALDIGIALGDASMSPIPEDSMEFGMTFLSGTLSQVLLETGPYEDEMQFGVSFLSGTLTQLLLETGPYDDAMNFGVTFLSGELVFKLIESYAPDEALQLGIALDEAACSMTPV